ncbi:methyltransferase-like protein 17, mitochondrial [Pectinophora gossypiella]|uniref:methyltransferase-like protein 17, mitochondrial n=1 Tax=Pectinophora gossypiella TaxID=13191 RepID=UPI00214F0229|nr:methyltransferase-like protein 17, mitochondrial [Pectinophora gossypiella]
MFRRLKLLPCSSICKNYSTKVEIDASLKENFESKVFKPRKHPGTTRVKIAAIPLDIQKAAKIILEDNGAKAMYQEAIKLNNYVRSRLLPPEEGDINKRAAKIHNSVSKQYFSKVNKELTPDEYENANKVIQTKVFNILKKKVYSWGNISFDLATSLQYLMVRAAPEYAILVRILDEIRKTLPDYKPRSFFDFGSGVGTGTWAVNTFWQGDIFEYFCVDTSTHMNDLARLILCNGKDNVEMPLKGFFQRQFLPASTDIKYNIVLSSFSLFELPSMKSRLETIQKLWNKTEDFLIIVEHGSNTGFQIVNEAREFVLNLPEGKNNGYVFSPCPNDNVCPRYMEHETPCNFLMKYESLPFPSKSEIYAEVFSYVILRKGTRPKNDPQWPRIVRAPIVRSGHTICKLCTAQGELKEIIFSKSKHDQTTYRCARSSNWGDLLPIK